MEIRSARDAREKREESLGGSVGSKGMRKRCAKTARGESLEIVLGESLRGES
jgi:hypothetical protein